MDRMLIDCELMSQREIFQVRDARDRNSATTKANRAETTGGIIRDLITTDCGRSESTRLHV
jgi:hypothetical protein